MKKLLTSMLFTCIGLSTLQAQCNLIYVGPANGDWHTAANWNLCKVPGANDIVTIPTGKSVRINNTNATCRTITVQAGGIVERNGTGTLTVTNSTGAVTCTAACSKRVFVTSTFHGGNLGGLTGADNICQTRANAASLGGTWKAWLSSTTVNANTRIVDAEYRRLDNQVIATSLADLTDGTINVPISISEFNTLINNAVWTNTKTNGTAVKTDPQFNCQNWTSNSATDFGVTGSSIDTTNGQWTHYYYYADISVYCLATFNLYCFEQ